MPVSEDIMSPPPAAAGAVWAKAEEINTGSLHNGYQPKGKERQNMAWQQGRIVSGQASWASSKKSLRGYFHTQRQGIFSPPSGQSEVAQHAAARDASTGKAGGQQIAARGCFPVEHLARCLMQHLGRHGGWPGGEVERACHHASRPGS
eukprot:gene25299-46291_t